MIVDVGTSKLLRGHSTECQLPGTKGESLNLQALLDVKPNYWGACAPGASIVPTPIYDDEPFSLASFTDLCIPAESHSDRLATSMILSLFFCHIVALD